MGWGQGWDLGLDLAKALVAALVGWPPAVELLAAGLAPPGVGWALAAVKAWGQALLPGCV